MKKIEYEVKPTYNLRKYIKYACEICGRVYSTIKDASICEQEHKMEECKKEDEED